MSSLKNRLAALEQATSKGAGPLILSRFVVHPGFPFVYDYTHQATGLVILREPEETEAALQDRCGDAVAHLGNSHLFMPILSETQGD